MKSRIVQIKNKAGLHARPSSLFVQLVTGYDSDITVKCDDAGGKNHKSMVLREALDLAKKIFSFRWVHPKIHKTIETTGVIITTIHNIKGTNQIIININPWAIPFLVYYGVGVGGTRACPWASWKLYQKAV